MDRIIAFVGSFVGVFEIVILPSVMFLVLDNKKKLMTPNQRIQFIIAISVIIPFYICGAFFSFYLK